MVVASNGDWRGSTNAGQISASGFAPENDLESAILITLYPGAYTPIVQDANNTTGVGIVEVFVQ